MPSASPPDIPGDVESLWRVCLWEGFKVGAHPVPFRRGRTFHFHSLLLRFCFLYGHRTLRVLATTGIGGRRRSGVVGRHIGASVVASETTGRPPRCRTCIASCTRYQNTINILPTPVNSSVDHRFGTECVRIKLEFCQRSLPIYII